MKRPKWHNSKSKRTVQRRSLSRVLTYARNLPADLQAALWHDPDRLFTQGRPLQVKDRGMVVRFDHPSGPLLLKRSTWGDLSRTLRSLHRESTARKCADIRHFLTQAGIPTPAVRAFLEHGPSPLSYRSYLVTDFVPGASLFHCLRYNLLADSDWPSIARQVAALWQQLIELNFSHNDLKPENFVVDESQRVWLIDVEKSRFHREPAKLRRKHLEDARIFLHVRNWREQRPAADIFRQALLNTTLGEWVTSLPEDDDHTLRDSFQPHELTCRLSVALVSQGSATPADVLAASAASVRDMADEIVVIEPQSLHGKLVPCHTSQLPQARDTKRNSPEIRATEPIHPWVLVLQPGEIATPDLVRELVELIADHPECDSIRVPVETLRHGRPLRTPRGSHPPLRAWDQTRCQATLQAGEITLKRARHTLTSPRKIQQTETRTPRAAPHKASTAAPHSTHRRAA